jgi:transcription-repair coupling factor (superfamily II helicase)
LFSDEYINNISERLSLYSELGTIKNEEELKLFQIKLIDRFGPMPPRAIALMNSIRIKWIATQVGIEKLVLKQGKMIYFVCQINNLIIISRSAFMSVMNFVQKTKFNL